MKNNFNTILLALLFVAVVVLYILHFTANRSNDVNICTYTEKTDTTVATAADTTAEAVTETSDTTAVHPASDIAYVNIDTLIEKYQYAKDLSAQMQKKETAARNQLNAKGKKLQDDYMKAQERMQKGLMSESEARTESENLAKQQQELQKLEQDLTKQMIAQQTKLNNQLRMRVQNFLKQYNKDKKYKIILSNQGTDNVLYAEGYLNITREVISELNKEYKNK